MLLNINHLVFVCYTLIEENLESDPVLITLQQILKILSPFSKHKYKHLFCM
jgi:hypothetical protein